MLLQNQKKTPQFILHTLPPCQLSVYPSFHFCNSLQ